MTQQQAGSSKMLSHIESLYQTHPVLNDRAKFPTPSIKRVYTVLANELVQHNPGCSFYAYSRFGKTSAIRVLNAMLAQTFPKIPMLTINAHRHLRFSELTYTEELLDAFRHDSKSGKALARRARFIKYLWSLAQERRSERILLFIDEAQNWSEMELTYLRDISNDLELEFNITLFSVCFGQPEMEALRNSLLQCNRQDLVGRFMLKQYQFRGITSLNELTAVMKCYDDASISEYPEGSGVSYTESLLRAAYCSGFRLAGQSGKLWNAFRAAAGKYKLDQVGMRWVSASIRNFLYAHIANDGANMVLAEDAWETAVRDSGFADSLGVTYYPKTV